MSDHLFLDLWQSRTGATQTGPLVPSPHRVQDPRKIYFLKQQISNLWQQQLVRDHNFAPNPVSLERQNLGRLKNSYVVTEKTDGVRYLLLLTQYPRYMGGQPCSVMVDRKDCFYEVRVMAKESYFHGTLIDGELVWEYENGNFAPPRQIYFAFDLIACKGISYVAQNLVKRYGVLSTLLDYSHADIVHDPRSWLETAQQLAEQDRVVCEGNQYCLIFRLKTMMPVIQLDIVWRQRKSLRHQSDGLIFTPLQEPVRTGTHPTMYKWKSHHTVDVEWHSEWQPATQTWQHLLYYEDKKQTCRGDEDGLWIQCPREVNLEASRVLVPLAFIPTEYARKIITWHYHRGETIFRHIIECSVTLPSITDWLAFAEDPQEHPVVELHMIKIRQDKRRPNQRLTLEKTLLNIQENITVKELLDTVTATTL